jgi:hypothetical protein
MENDELEEKKDIHEGLPNYEKSPEKEESLFKKIFFHKTLNYIVISIISIIIFVVVFLVRGYDKLQSYLDAAFVTCIFDLCMSGLSATTNQGVFDSLGYGFDRMFKSVFTGHYKYRDLIEFKDARVEKRERNKYTWAPYLVIGLIFVIITIILYFINEQQIQDMLK